MKFFYIYLSLCSLITMTSIFLSKMTNYDKEKTTPFECGFDPNKMTRTPFSLQFFKISIIFIIFDIEIILILPTLLSFNNFNSMYFYSLTIILIMIIGGLFFEWYQGSLNWMKLICI